MTVAYGQYVKTPKWTTRRTWAFGIAANVLGLVVGQVKRASAHAAFVRSLENQRGFLTALQGIAGEGAPGSGVTQNARPTHPEDAVNDGPSITSTESVWTPAEPKPVAAFNVTPTASGRDVLRLAQF